MRVIYSVSHPMTIKCKNWKDYLVCHGTWDSYDSIHDLNTGLHKVLKLCI